MSEPGPTKQKVNNFLKAMESGPTRLLFLGGLGLAFIVAIVAFNALRPSKPKDDGSTELQAVPTPSVPSSRAAAQPVNTEAYDALTKQNNADRAADAKETGGTAMPIPRVGQAQPEAPEPSVLPTDVDATSKVSAGPSAAAADDQAARQQHEKDVAERYDVMAKQFDKLVNRWAGAGEAMSLRAAVPPEAAQQVAPAAAPAAAVSAMDLPAPDIRANQAFLGVAMSEANTDDSLPIVRAKILNGPAKGAMLMGSIETSEDAPGGLVRFTLLSPADGGASTTVDAVAIDPHTSRSSVASDVNRHTISRMGALFFSSILSGVGEGLLKGGQQEQVITSEGNVVVQRDAYSDRDLALIGLGKVGTNGAQMMQGAINRKPTVKLNLNTEIGVLFLKDVSLGHSAQSMGTP